MGDRVRFVDAISASPTVRLDLNDESKWSVAARDFPPPALRRTESRTMLTDGAYVGRSAHDNRVLKLTLNLIETTQDLLALETQKLARELDRDTNILEYRPTGATNSIFFRTFRSPPQDIQDLISATAIRDHQVEILAEPFGLGLPEDIALSVSNDPTATTNLVPNPSIEVDTTGWVAHANCTIARSTTQKAAGVASLQMTASSAADMTSSTTRGTGGIPATVGTSYTAQAKFFAATTGRSCRVNIAWFNAAGALLSTSTGSTVTDSANWTLASVTATAPANTAFAAVEATVLVPANAEVHYVDTVQLAAQSFRSAYFDGSYGGRWTGTAHASTSIRNGLSADVTGIKGDVVTRPLIQYVGIATTSFAHEGLIVGLRSGASPYPTVALQAESMGQGDDTSVVADATFSGGSKSRCTFTTNPTVMAVRLIDYAPEGTVGPHGSHVLGTYRVLIRVQKTVGTDDIRMQWDTFTNPDRSPEVTLPSGTLARLVDLGIFDVDRHGPAPRTAGYSSTAFRIEELPEIRILAKRVTGSGSLDMDYVLFVPADESVGMWTGVNGAGGGLTPGAAVVDGPNDQVYGVYDAIGATPGISANVGTGDPPGISGSLPHLPPGDSRLVIAGLNPSLPGTSANEITQVFTGTIRYWPRYVYVRPSAT